MQWQYTNTDQRVGDSWNLVPPGKVSLRSLVSAHIGYAICV